MFRNRTIGGRAHALSLDLMESNGVKDLISWLDKKNLAPDIIVHNLGGSLGVKDVLSDQSAFAKVWKFNVGIGVEINRHFIPKMCDKNYGRIVHISTLSAKLHTGNLPYVSAKCALEGYVKNISKKFAKHNVLINAVAPGLVDLPGRYYTELKVRDPVMLQQYFDDHLPLGRMINPSDVADVVKFLCFGESTVMSGAILPVDGGGY